MPGIVLTVHTAANASMLLEAGDWTLLRDCGCVSLSFSEATFAGSSHDL